MFSRSVKEGIAISYHARRLFQHERVENSTKTTTNQKKKKERQSATQYERIWTTLRRPPACVCYRNASQKKENRTRKNKRERDSLAWLQSTNKIQLANRLAPRLKCTRRKQTWLAALVCVRLIGSRYPLVTARRRRGTIISLNRGRVSYTRKQASKQLQRNRAGAPAFRIRLKCRLIPSLRAPIESEERGLNIKEWICW